MSYDPNSHAPPCGEPTIAGWAHRPHLAGRIVDDTEPYYQDGACVLLDAATRQAPANLWQLLTRLEQEVNDRAQEFEGPQGPAPRRVSPYAERL